MRVCVPFDLNGWPHRIMCNSGKILNALQITIAMLSLFIRIKRTRIQISGSFDEIVPASHERMERKRRTMTLACPQSQLTYTRHVTLRMCCFVVNKATSKLMKAKIIE